jgi:hypothetical protein
LGYATGAGRPFATLTDVQEMLQMPPPTGIAVLATRSRYQEHSGRKKANTIQICLPQCVEDPTSVFIRASWHRYADPARNERNPHARYCHLRPWLAEYRERQFGSAVRVWKKNLDGTTDLSVPGTIFFSHQALFVVA